MKHSTGNQVKIVVVMGVSGSGKSTIAALMAGELGWDYAEADDFHPQANIDKMSAGIPLTDEDRWPWLQKLRNWIDEEVAAGRQGVLTCSALKRSYRDLLRGDGVVFVHMAGSRDVVSARLAARQGHFMPAALLDSQIATLEPLDDDEDGLILNLDLGQNPQQEAAWVMEQLELTPSTGSKPTIGMVGLGKMGAGLTARLRYAGLGVVGFDQNPDSERDADSLADLVSKLPSPRIVWVMVPAGKPTDSVIEELDGLLTAGDLVIDGGNSRWKDDAVHAEQLAKHGIGFIDVGTSGGVWGLENGFALMVGGSKENVDLAMPFFKALTPAEDGFVHAGEVGAGHLTKMVHNGVEYGMMQALGEGYDFLVSSPIVTNPDAAIASWRHGSVVRSWLLDLLGDALQEDPGLTKLAARADESGEARWMIEDALQMGVPLPVTAASLYARQISTRAEWPAIKVVAALRNQFGGHATYRDKN
jgi:6-phosphogluconate dehydrogenase